MRLLVVVLVITAVWLVLASVREDRGQARAADDVGGIWMIEQHDPVVRLGHQAVFPTDHPLARLSIDADVRRG